MDHWHVLVSCVHRLVRKQDTAGACSFTGRYLPKLARLKRPFETTEVRNWSVVIGSLGHRFI